MPTLEQYKDRVFASHPELIDQYVDADIELAQGRLDKATVELAELTELKATLHPAPEVPEQTPEVVGPEDNQ